MLRKLNSKYWKKVGVAILFIAAPLFANAHPLPDKPLGFVNDFAEVISEDVQVDLESRLTALRQTTGVEFAVVTVIELDGETIETFATKLFERWGIGDKDIDNGLLLLVAPKEREVRIEVGYGLEGTVTDIQSGNIIRNVMLPSFREDKMSEGIINGANALIGIIEKAPGSEIYSVPPPSESEKSYDFGALAFIAIIAFNVFARMLGKTKSWWLGGVLGAIAGGIIGLIFGFILTGIFSIIGLTLLGLIVDYFLSKHFNRPGGPHPWFIGGGGMGGKGGGSFGGFGGGMSGGGGASGRW